MLNKKNILILLKSGIIAQILPILTYPIITRFYSTEDFGLYSTVLSIITTISVFIILKLDQALPISENKDKISLIRLSIISTILISISTLLILIMLKNFDLIHNIDFKTILLLVVSILLNGFINLYIGINISNGEFAKNANNQIIRSLFLATTQMIAGIIGYLEYGLIISFIIAQIISLIFLTFNNYQLVKSLFSENWKIKSDLNLLFSKYRDFPLFLSPTGLVNTLGMTVPILLISNIYGLTYAGFYGLVTRAFMTPLNVISLSISQPLFKDLSDNRNSKYNLKDIFIKSFIILVTVSVFPLNLFSGSMEFIFEKVFSSTWKVSGEIALYLMPWMSINFVLSPLLNLYIVLRKQSINLFINIIITLSRITVIIISGALNFDFSTMILLFGLISFIFAFVQLLILFKLINVSLYELIRFIVLPISFSIMLSYFININFTPIYSIIICTIIILIYFIILKKRLKGLLI